MECKFLNKYFVFVCNNLRSRISEKLLLGLINLVKWVAEDLLLCGLLALLCCGESTLCTLFEQKSDCENNHVFLDT